MPPVKTSAPVTDADNEITAELPVLDVAAYEASINEPLPAAALEEPASDSTVLMTAAAKAKAKAKFDPELSGTHEMPALPPKKSKSAPAVITDTPEQAAAAAVAAPTAASTARAGSMPVPPSPPLIEELRGSLAAAERRIEELNERARIADVERSTAIARATAEAEQLRQQLGIQSEELQAARVRLDSQGAAEKSLRDEISARDDRIKALQDVVASRDATIGGQVAQIESARVRSDKLDVDVMNLRATVAHRDSRIGILEADLLARQQREMQINSRLADALAATDPHAPLLRSEIAARDAEVRRMSAEIQEYKARLAEREEDLQVAEESLRNLEIDVRDKGTKLNEANVTVEEWRAVIAESQRSIIQRDNRIHELEADLEKRVAAFDVVSHEPDGVALEGPARVLIRTDGNTDFVHVLGRRTRIGRGPDNELVLDTKHVSRFHAVLLAGPVHTAIEDLNSTNGVFVNGKRIARQILKDGDRVTVGRTQFRYSVRPSERG
jgi:predicted  nucleic acid-binding Zn-ribbon protein